MLIIYYAIALHSICFLDVNGGLFGYFSGQSVSLYFVNGFSFLFGNVIWEKNYFSNTSNNNYCNNLYLAESKYNFKTYMGFNISLYNEYHATYFSFSNVFFTPDNIIAIPDYRNTGHVLFAVKPKINSKGYISGFESTNCSTDFYVYCNFKKAILAFGAYTWTYGHFYWDILAPLMLFPKSAFVESYIFVVDEMYDIARESLKICYGIRPENILRYSYKLIYYADELFYYTSVSLALGHINLTKNFMAMFMKKAKITQRNPDKYCFQNRNHFIRPIKNFDSLLDATRKKYNQHEWTVLPTSYSSLVNAAKDFSRIKMVIMPSGSALFNTLFMPENGVVIDFMTEEFNQNDVFLAYCANIFLVAQIGCNNCVHFNGTFNINAETLFSLIDIGFLILEKKGFPSTYKRYTGTKCWTEI